MPTYGYQCTQCKHEFQVFQSMKDEPISRCPECGGPVKRLLYPVGVVFKGSGWYVTDSRKPEPSAESKNDDGNKTAEKSAGEKSVESSAESKPSSDKTSKAEAA